MFSRAVTRLSTQQIHKCPIRTYSNSILNQGYPSLSWPCQNHISSNDTKNNAIAEISVSRSRTNNSFETGVKKPFSTAVATDDAENVPLKKKKKPRRRLKLDAITVTENAAARIKELLRGEGAKDAIGIRLGVKRRKYVYCTK